MSRFLIQSVGISKILKKLNISLRKKDESILRSEGQTKQELIHRVDAFIKLNFDQYVSTHCKFNISNRFNE